jgi:hypothetical protein
MFFTLCYKYVKQKLYKLKNKIMEKRTITLDGVDYYLIPKSNKTKLPEGVEIKFEKTEVKTYFDIRVKGWSTKDGKPYWCLFRRIENEDGSFEWTDWSTGGVKPTREKELIIESWYQNHINS